MLRIKVTEPLSENELTEKIHVISQNLGLFNDRDKEKSCYRIFIELLKARKDHISLTSQQLADKSHLSRATVLHHVEKLISSGIVLEQERRFQLREVNLNRTILKLKKQMTEIYEEMERISHEVDKELGI